MLTAHRARRGCAPFTLLLCCLPFAMASTSERCELFASQGFCTNKEKSTYMNRHCASYCEGADDASAVGAGSTSDDEQCAQWASDGYCYHEQYSSYMTSHCPESCGVKPVDEPQGASEVGDDDDAAEGEEDEDPEEGDETDDAESEEDTMEGDDEDSDADPAAEPESCAGWAAQGYCEDATYMEYMRQNCVATCKGAKSGLKQDSSTSESSEDSNSECFNWAVQGHCGESSAYYRYMSTNCKNACMNAPTQPMVEGDGLPPPVSLPLIILLVGFFTAAAYGVKFALNKDIEKGGFHFKKAHGIAAKNGEIGPGYALAGSAKAIAKAEKKRDKKKEK